MSVLKALVGVISGPVTISGSVDVTCGGGNYVALDLSAGRIRGYSDGTNFDTLVFTSVDAAGSRTPTELNGLSVVGAYTSKDNVAPTITFWFAVPGDRTGSPLFTTMLKKNGGSTEDTFTLGSNMTASFDGTNTWYTGIASVEWPTSGTRTLVIS